VLLPGREAASCPRVYRPRRPRDSPLYELVDGYYDEVKGKWEDHFQCRYGFWRGAVEDVVYAFLDCGILDHGFARVRCDECRAEFLVAFSAAHSLAALGPAVPARRCAAPAGPDQRRSFCPSCAAKRGAIFGALLAEEVLEDVTVPINSVHGCLLVMPVSTATEAWAAPGNVLRRRFYYPAK
jgi:hypothetical protein